jgi:hypothetical protein
MTIIVQAKNFLRQAAKNLHFKALSRAETISRWSIHPVAKRERYIAALDKEFNGCVTGFVKWEYVKSKGNPRPRIIQFRDPAYLAAMEPWYAPLEKACSHTPFAFTKHDKYVIAKGWNPHDRMLHILDKVSDLDDPVVICCDGSAFDAHQAKENLKLEWFFYKICLLLNDINFDITQLKKKQLKNRCFYRSREGTVKYTVDGNRMSGDRNTGMGNSILTVSYILSSLAAIDGKNYRFYVDGDDFILLASRSFSHLVRAAIISGFHRFGQDLKVEKTADLSDGLEGIDFCQSRPVLIDGEWRLIRNPYKVINGYSRNRRWFENGELAKRYFSTISKPEIGYNAGVPVLQSYFLALLKVADGAAPLASESRRWWLRNSHFLNPSPVCECTRTSFRKAFDISEVEQEFFEREFDMWCPDTTFDGYRITEYK